MTTLLREMIKSRAAIECYLLVAFLAYNIFHAFLARNVKPAARQSKTQIFWAQLIAAELYGDLTPTGILPWGLRALSFRTSARPGNPHRGLPARALFGWRRRYG